MSWIILFYINSFGTGTFSVADPGDPDSGSGIGFLLDSGSRSQKGTGSRIRNTEGTCAEPIYINK
jgi:hypothetical protein